MFINQNKFNSNGIAISLHEKYATLSYQRHVAQLEKLCELEIELSFLVSHYACGSYILSVPRHDLTYSFSKSSQVVTPNKDDIRLTYNAVNVAKNKQSRGMRFVPLELVSIRLVIFSDAHFATGQDSTSQLGLTVALWTNCTRRMSCTTVASRLRE